MSSTVPPHLATTLFVVLALFLLILNTHAAPPDLTEGGVPNDALIINLGPTGMRGWVYHVKDNTGESSGRYSFGLLTLLAGNNPSDPATAGRLSRAQTEARAMIPNAATRAPLMPMTSKSSMSRSLLVHRKAADFLSK
jgi:hypothetical protein